MNCTRRVSLSGILLLILLAVIAAWNQPVAAHPSHDDPAHEAVEQSVATLQHGDAQKEDESDDEDDDDDEKKEDEDEEKWDVSKVPGPATDVVIDTDEGTWMNLDVSPDGAEIAFDLLGDIYIMPMAGGKATLLTSDVEWDMQPRFSPDSKRIAFTSDRGGGDNIWIMNRDGSDVKQVTKEKFRLLNQPAWDPGGEYIVARKHFTSRRSIGAGEMWLYHHSGGDGLQMTEKPNKQKDVGEPMFSPDGRYLYYSQDVTPGDRFQYNKDSNGQIYAIKRLDRIKGETETYISGAGGSIRPTPSPDGKWVAFARRVRSKTVLFIHDTKSGKEIPLYDALERDMQEAWAIHGVYPTMAWTPDSGAIVFWSGGKIRRIDIQSKRVDVIPFHVHTTKQIAEALRFPVEVAPDEFDVKLLRWVRVAPDGKSVIYQALDRLYTRALPDGQPRRLTGQEDHGEYYPSISRNGQWVVYATFSDEHFGSIRIVSTAGGEGRVITTEPGHYVEPVFSPDGRRIVYRKIGGNAMRGRTWSHDTGMFWVDAIGGTPMLITKKGSSPQFGRDNDRLFFTNVTFKEGKGSHALMSIDLDGSDERKHLVSENATEFSLSSDEKWVAFVERFNTYIAPFVRTGKEIKIGPKTKSIPVKKVSRDTGLFLQWSGDNTKLHWSYGPELFTRDLKDAFDFMPGAAEELPEPVESGLNISFKATSDVPTGKLALTGARIITMHDNEIILNGTIVVEGNRIVAVGPVTTVPIPADATRIDVRGKTIMPGIVDVHAHGRQGSSGFIPQQNWGSFANLAFGVTTIHDPSNDTNTIFAAAEMARAGMITSPRIFSTGTILYGAAGSFKAEVNSLDDARSHLRRMKAAGAISVKSYNQPRRNQRQQVITAARELEMMVVPEGGSLYQHNMTMIIDGHTGIEHNIPVANAYKDCVDLWAASGTGYTPTLVVAYGGITGERYWYQHTDVWANERLLTFVPRDVVDPRSRRRYKAPEEEYNHISAARVCKDLTDAGVRVNLGAHGQMAGLAAHWELWMFEQGGMTPLEALRSATINGAKYVGLDADIGSLEVGKLADLIVLDANPLGNIRHSEGIKYTMINGSLFDARTMDQIGNHPKARAPFYWER